MGLTETDLLRLTGMIYEAATDSTLLLGFLKAYAEALAADITGFQVHDFLQHCSEALVFWGTSVAPLDSYNAYYSKLNVWREHAERKYLPGRVLTSEEMYPYELFIRSEFYNDFMRSFGAAHGNAAVIARDADRALTLTALRPEGREPFGEQECQVTRILLPHLTRANQIRQKLGIFQASEDLLNSSPTGVVFLADSRKVVHANRTAEDILRSNDGLSLRSGMLYASLPVANAAVERSVRLAVSQLNTPSCPKAVLVERRSMRRPYQVVIAPLRSQFPWLAGDPRAVALITDPERTQDADNAPLLIQIYGLTSKEASVAIGLSDGKSVQQVAQELEMSYETARTHLRRIFSKTGTSRQSELVMLLGKLPKRVPGA